MKALRLLVALVAILSLVTCAGVPIDQRPPGCEESIIYEKFTQPTIMGGLIQLSLYELAKHKGWKTEIIESLDKHQGVLSNPGVTYVQFATGIVTDVKEVNETAGVELLIITTMAQDLMLVTTPILDCDRVWFLNQIAQSKIWVQMVES